jgi:hypothetical protein
MLSLERRRCNAVCASSVDNERASAWPLGHSAAVWGAEDDGSRPSRQAVLSKRGRQRKNHPVLGFTWGIPAYCIAPGRVM